MATTQSSGQERIDVEPRTRRAIEGCMVVVPESDASGIFDVYSATGGHNEIYTVDLRAETCECADYEHRQPAGGCKHIRRVKLGLGILPLPPGIELDGCLIDTRAKYGVDVDGDGEANPGRSGVLDARTRDSCGKEAGAAVTDGGQAVITGPHMEPPEVSNATTFWRCSECGRESIREQDVYRTTFHAEGCAGSEGR